MKSKWVVQANPVGGEMLSIAMRKLRNDEILHGGHIEHHGEYTTDRAAVEELVNRLNAEEGL